MDELEHHGGLVRRVQRPFAAQRGIFKHSDALSPLDKETMRDFLGRRYRRQQITEVLAPQNVAMSFLEIHAGKFAPQAPDALSGDFNATRFHHSSLW